MNEAIPTGEEEGRGILPGNAGGAVHWWFARLSQDQLGAARLQMTYGPMAPLH